MAKKMWYTVRNKQNWIYDGNQWDKNIFFTLTEKFSYTLGHYQAVEWEYEL